MTKFAQILYGKIRLLKNWGKEKFVLVDAAYN